MIQLAPAPRPPQLTDEFIEEQTARFCADNSLRVWGNRFITDTLLAMSFGKCCFCETDLKSRSDYMEVEHFFAKNLYPNWVLSWENLLPGCKRCNGKKREHDCLHIPIIHPVVEDPRDHLTFKDYRFKGKTEIGKTTIQVVDLNNFDRLQIPRFEVGERTRKELEKLQVSIEEYLAGHQPPLKLQRIISTLEGLMTAGQPEKEYASTVATEILREDSYHFAKSELEKLNLWDEEFQNLEIGLKKIAY